MRGGTAAARAALCHCLSVVNKAGLNGQAGFSISRYDLLYGRTRQADALGGITFLCLDDSVSIFIPPIGSVTLDNSTLAGLGFI